MKKTILSLTLIIAFSGTAMAQSAFEEYQARTGRAPKITTSTQSTGASMPTGAVMPFDLGGRCPSGWSKWDKAAGRVIVGTGKRNGESYKTNQIGGKAKTFISAESIKKGKTMMSGFTIKVDENSTPPYVMVADSSVYYEECLKKEKHCTRFPSRDFTVEVGSEDTKPFDNRQPFIAMTYCRKD